MGMAHWLRALASHQCCPGSIWVEFVVGSRPCSEGYSPGSPVFLPPKKPAFLNSISTWNARSPLKRCSVGKQITFYAWTSPSCCQSLSQSYPESSSLLRTLGGKEDPGTRLHSYGKAPALSIFAVHM